MIAEAGQPVQLGIELLSVIVTPLDLDFTPSGPPDACFSQLEVRFDVTIVQPTAVHLEERETVLV